MTSPRSYRFGAFRLDASARVLFEDGQRVALTPKAVDVLVMLIEARGEIVSRDQLLQAVWAGTVVEEGSLTSHISQLRKSLGDGLIETLSKRGYRFTGRIEGEAGSPPQSAQAVQEAVRTNLPPPLTAFIGRGEALVQVGALVRRSRMVTLVGAGGTGKTRLSVEACRQLAAGFPDGIWLVELAPLTDAALVPRAIVNVLGARAEGDTPPMALIESTLRGRRVLLLIDNCEHVVDEAAKVAQALLKALPQVHLLATSREPLVIEGETVYRVPSLVASEAEQLFVERAAAVRPDFALTEANADTVAQVCRRLDGIPLAIELAAARLTALSVDEIARRIDDRFHLLTGGLRTALPRQRTLRALVDWSYELLSLQERRVLDTLSVFAGTFSLEAAEKVCGDGADVLDIVDSLVAKSLVIAQAQEGAETRYRLLETIRQYGMDKLAASGRTEAARQRHFAYFAGVAQAGAKGLEGPQALEWLDRLDAENDNLRAALDAAVDADPAGYARLAGTLRFYWDIRGHYAEGWSRLDRALAVHPARDAARMHALIGAGMLAFRLAYAHERSATPLNEAIALAQELDDPYGEAEATLAFGHTHRQQQAEAARAALARALDLARLAGSRRLETLVNVELARLDISMDEPRAHLQQALLESLGRLDELGCVIDAPSALLYAGSCALEQLDFATARRLLEKSLAQHRRIGFTHETAETSLMLGQLALNEGRVDEARALTSEALRTFRALHDPKCGARSALHHAWVLTVAGDADAALPHAESAVATYRELDLPSSLAWALRTAGCIHAAMGQHDAARRTLFTGLIEQQRASRNKHLPGLLEGIAGTHADSLAAVRLLGAASALRERLDIPLQPTERAQRDGWVADMRAKHAGAEFDRAFADGRALTREEAVEGALALRRPA